MKTILTIEDNDLLLDTMRDFLEAEGFYVLSANNGLDGIRMAIEHVPDLIVCDIEMPKMNGLEVYKILQENNETCFIPFIFLTARATKEDMRTGMQMGVDDYITKPFDYDELITSINTRIQKREKLISHQRENYRVLFDNAISGIFILQHKLIVYHNTRFLQIVGYTADEIKKMNILDAIVQDDKKALLKKITNCIKGIQRHINTEFRIISGNRKIITLKVSAGLTRYNNKLALLGSIINVENTETAEKDMVFNNFSAANVEEALSLIEKNKHFITPSVAQKIKEIYQYSKQSTMNDLLTPREKEVLEMVVQGFTSQQIADKLFISIRTINRHRENLYNKTGTKNSVDLVIFAIRNNLIEV